MRQSWKLSSFVFLLALTTLAGPATAAEDCRLTRAATIQTLPTASGGMLVPVTIGDTPKLLLLDTGGAITDISRPAAEELKVPTFQGNIKLVGIGGETSDRFAILPSLTIGGMQSKSVKVMISPGSGPLDPNDNRLAGTLVLVTQGKIDIDLDFAGNRLNIFSSNHCDGKVVYWSTSPYAVVPMRVARDSGHIVIRVSLNGVPLNAWVDTGASTTLLNLSIATTKLGLDLNAPDVESVGQLGNDTKAKTYRRRFKTLAFEGVTVNDPMVTLVPDKMANELPQSAPIGSLIRTDDPDQRLPDLVVGMSVLSKLHVYIASKERKLYITPAAPAASAAPAAQ